MNKEVKMKEGEVSEVKKKEVETLKTLFKEYETIALVDLISLPSHQLQIMRSKLKKDGVIVRVTKKRLIIKALENFKGKEGIEEFTPFLEKTMPALIFSKLNAFKLSQFLRKNKSKAAAKPGQIAPKDLVVNAGPTPFTPGPMIGELGSLGIKAAVENGKITVKQDTVVVKEGQEVNAKVADLLAKLDIKPMEIGLSLVAAYEDGVVVDKSVLDIDESIYVDEIKRIASDAFKLTVGIGYVTPENIKLLLSKASREVEAVVEAAGILTEGNVKKMLGKASKQAGAIEKLVPEQSPTKEETPKVEENKEAPQKEEASAEESKEKEQNLKEEKSQEIKEEKDMIDIIDNKVPTAEELAEKKRQKEEASKTKENKDHIPDLHELAEKKKGNKEAEKVPSAHELAEKKKGKEEN